MDRRNFLAGAAAAGAVSAVPGLASAQGAAAPGAADARLRTMLDAFFYARLDDNPEGATSLGLDTGERAGLKAKLSDASRAQAAREVARAKRELAQLRGVGRDGLSANARLDYDVVEYSLERTLEGERFDYGATGGRYAPYTLSQLTGAYRGVPDFLSSTHRVTSAADADAYVARVEAFARVVDQETEYQREDAAKGVFAPDYILDTALKQYASLRDQPAGQTGPVKDLAAKLKAANLPPERAQAVEKLMAERVFPAIDRQRALVTELRGRATHDAGVWRLPGGEAYYSAAASAATTVDMSGDEIHRLGLQQVGELQGGIDSILKAQGMTQGSVGERLVALNKRPDQLFANTDAGREELLAMLRRQIGAMEARLPEQFGTLPRAPIEVRRVPEAIQAGSAGAYYQAATLDGSRPGIYFINLRDTFDRPKFGLATLSHHEGVPGHHLQVMLALESEDIPLIRRRGGYSGYSEGWALYTEQLADEMGMYEGDPLGRVGYLQSLLFRATRLVVDSGLHAKRWSREKATDYFLATTGIARGRGQNEIDRYTVWPGQACSYKIGHTRWVALRDSAKARMGERWDPRAFHRVLTMGAVPLSVLERVVEERVV